MLQSLVGSGGRSLLLILLFWVSTSAFAENALRVAFLSAEPVQISALIDVTAQYEQLNPGINVEVQAFSDAAFKANIDQWLENGDFDVIHWQAGQRLMRYVESDLVSALNEFINVDELNQHFDKTVLGQLERNGQFYGLPIATYAWGFYYNKHLFEQLELTPPKTWKEFQAVSQALHLQGVKPLIQSNESNWETLIWLDYLSLQLGGEPLRQQIASGKEVDKALSKQLLAPLTDMVRQDYFFAPDHEWVWVQAVAAVARGLAGMTLTGQFAEESIADILDDKIGFFPFPDSERLGSVAPLDVWILPRASSNKLAAADFLRHLMVPQVHTDLALGLGWLPTLKEVGFVSNTPRVKAAQQHLSNAALLTQYFDRDSEQSHAVVLDRYLDILFATKSAQPLIDYLAGGAFDRIPEIAPKAADKKRIDISTISGVNGTFLASKIMQAVYADLGFSVNITRFPTTEAAMQSHRHGMDAELGRTESFQHSTSLIMIDEPILSMGLYTLLPKSLCDSNGEATKLPEVIGISADAEVMQNWAKQRGVRAIQFDNTDDLFSAFNRGDIGGIIAFETSLTHYPNTVQTACRTKVEQVDIYHFLNPLNAELKTAVTQGLRAFKQSEDYQVLMSPFTIDE